MKVLMLPIALVMTLGSSVGATLIRSDGGDASNIRKSELHATLPTQAQIAAWKATAATTDYTPPAPPR